MTEDEAGPPPFPDEADREAIRCGVDVNMIVEAAAGTGKTTSLVARLMTLFRRGALAGDERLAAVTFTRKAAAELRERLDRALGEALAEGAEIPGAERKNLETARDALPECHIGTIHSFCARLLRERPVEAGVGPDFREADDADDLPLRRRAWEEFTGEMLRGGHPDLHDVFGTFGLDQDALGKGFETFAEFPDVDEWIGSGERLDSVDPGAFAAGVEAYLARIAGLGPDLAEAECGNDKLIPILQILDRRYPRLRKPLGTGDAFRLSALCKESPAPVLKEWSRFGLDNEGARKEAAAYAEFYDRTVAPFRADCLAVVYGAALRAYRLARDAYDRLRAEAGLLNFQDLLLLTARMLRDFPAVRRDLGERYSRLLVDEVQDTDPAQAEIMFLLASTDTRRRDWRRCRPRPGSLFIVGDPKQSIYRFRRADITVYQEVKRLIADSGGKVLGLTTNFRSQPAIIEWINATFGPAEDDGGVPGPLPENGRFPARDTPHSPAYIPLTPGLPAARPECLSGVFSLETMPFSRKDGIGDREIVRDEAARIAAFIRDAVDRGTPIPSRDGPRPAGAGDFLIITYQKASSAIYARALRRLGLPCLVSGGGTLRDSAALSLLLQYLGALAAPHDPVALTAVLRGELHGISDPDLYRWKKAGGSFSFSAPPAAGGPAAVAAALERMERHHRLFRRAGPMLALGQVLDDLGLWAHGCLADDPALGAGMIACAVELLQNDRTGMTSIGNLVERLSRLIETHEKDPLPAKSHSGDAVRIMNLHKTKGLEAPVVFLTGTRGMRAHPPQFSVTRRDGGADGALTVAQGEYGAVTVAQPANWPELSDNEKLFLEAERIRLNYVAATRAGAALVVSVHQSNKVWRSAFLPGYKHGATIADKLPEPANPPVPPDDGDLLTAVDPAVLDAGRAAREKLRPAMLSPSYQVRRAKPDGWHLSLPRAAESDESGDSALVLGDILHRLLERRRDDAGLAAMAESLLREHGLPPGHGEALIEMTRMTWASRIWERAEAAEETYREAPFTVRPDGGAEVVRGVIDLVFREKDGWVIVDYKTDRPAWNEDPETAAGRHREQLQAYARAWSGITGGRVVETGIYFTRTNKYVVVPVPARAYA